MLRWLLLALILLAPGTASAGGVDDANAGIAAGKRHEWKEAIRLYTRQAAYLSWDEANKGSIESGKFADLIVLDRDILRVPDRDLLDAKVDQTYVGGRLVYDLFMVASK